MRRNISGAFRSAQADTTRRERCCEKSLDFSQRLSERRLTGWIRPLLRKNKKRNLPPAADRLYLKSVNIRASSLKNQYFPAVKLA